METQKQFSRQFSFEFFPPKSPEAEEKLVTTREKLATLKPLYYSVTFGAGGSTQQGTYDTVKSIIEAGHEAAPHMSCISSSKSQIRDLLQGYRELGVKRIVALRGDIPSGMGRTAPGELRYANELVEFIRAETGDAFHLEVGAYPEYHPQARSAQADLQNFARKVKAGADGAITQYFYNPDAYFRFVDDCESMGLDIPIIPGVMPIVNFAQLQRFSDTCGAEIPRYIRKRLEGMGDDKESIRKFGTDVTIDLCRNLLEGGAPGLHFYTLNQARASQAIWEALDLDRWNQSVEAA